MSCISNGAVYSQRPLVTADLAAIDQILTGRADRLVRTRKGRVWTLVRDDVSLDLRVERLDDVLGACEDELGAIGWISTAGASRVFISAGRCGDREDDEIAHLAAQIAAAVDGRFVGPRRSH